MLRMNDLEQDNWKGTEAAQLGGHGFQGATFGVDGSCKVGRWGSCKHGKMGTLGQSAVKSMGEKQTNWHESEETRNEYKTGRNLGEIC